MILEDREKRANEQAIADSLRLIHQVDIVLDYLKAQGYELPKIPAVIRLTITDIGDSVNVKIK